MLLTSKIKKNPSFKTTDNSCIIVVRKFSDNSYLLYMLSANCHLRVLVSVWSSNVGVKLLRYDYLRREHSKVNNLFNEVTLTTCLHILYGLYDGPVNHK